MWERLILWIRVICFYQQKLNHVIDWLRSGFTSHSTQNRSFWRRFPKPISRLGMKKLNLTQQKHTFTNQKKCTTQNKHKRTKARCSCLLQNPAWKRTVPILVLVDNVYGAVLMTMVTARVHPVHLMNADWAPGGRQPSDQANQLGHRYGCYHPHPPSPSVIITHPESWYSFFSNWFGSCWCFCFFITVASSCLNEPFGLLEQDNRLTEIMSNIPLDKKWVILETFFPVNHLAQ